MTQNYTGMRPVLVEYYFSPAHYDVILSTHNIIDEK